MRGLPAFGGRHIVTLAMHSRRASLHPKAPSHRPESAGQILRAELARLIQSELRDPRLGFTTVLDAVMSPDLRRARVLVSVMGTEDKRAALAALTGASGFLRREAARRLALRFAPELHFTLADEAAPAPSENPE